MRGREVERPVASGCSGKAECDEIGIRNRAGILVVPLGRLVRSTDGGPVPSCYSLARTTCYSPLPHLPSSYLLVPPQTTLAGFPVMSDAHEIPLDVLNGLSQTTRTGIERLRRHQPEVVDAFVPLSFLGVRIY